MTFPRIFPSPLVLPVVAVTLGAHVSAAEPRDIEVRVDDLVARMTLEEKIGQTTQRHLSGIDTAPDWAREAVAAGRIGSFLNVAPPELLDELQRIAVEDSRLGIPLLFGRDVIHGYKTIFPIPLGLAASWNPEHARQGARVSAVEATTAGYRWTFAPMMDIARDPRWGRIAESFGEDPFLASAFAAAMVEGFQTDDPTDPTAMAACAKHFVGYGAAEGGRDYNTAWIPEREMRDVYLKPFRAAANAGCLSMMSAFQDINGIPASGNRRYLKDVLRDEWGWDGFVVSDWDSVVELIQHGFAADEKEAARRAFNAGVNMEMSSDAYEKHLAELIKEGAVAEAWLDEMVRQILRAKFRLGLFESPHRASGQESRILRPESLQLARQAAIDSVVMLKNDNGVLPLAKEGRTYAVIGPMADAPHDQMGTWVFDGEAKDSVVPLQAITDLIGKDAVHYAPGLTYSRDAARDGFAAAIDAAKRSDAVLFFGGEESLLSGEAHSLADLGLRGAQNELIGELAALGKPLVLIVMSGRPNTMQAQIAESDAVLVAFHGGTMAGPALADLLFGIAAPSGRLPVTWPVQVGQVPIYYNHRNTGRPPSPETFVPLDRLPPGSSQFSTGSKSFYIDIGYQPAFPFGFGLTYSTFDYRDLELSAESIPLGGSIEATATITNTGAREATEVVQLYVRDLAGDVTRPVRELKGFQRVALAPGASRKVSFKLHTDELSFHNSGMKEVTEPGEFHLWVAPHAAGGLQGTFRIE